MLLSSVGVTSMQPIPFCWLEIVGAIVWLWGLYLVLRVSAYRVNRPGHKGYFGVPYFWNIKFLSRSNFASEGQGLLRWLWVAGGAFGVLAVLAVFMCR